MKTTKVQLALIREGVRNPDKLPPLYGSGGGLVIADPRTIRSLIANGLAFQRTPTFRDERCRAYLTRAAFELVGATLPPKRHPFNVDEPWP